MAQCSTIPWPSPGIIALVQCARTLLRLAYRPHEITEARITELAPLLDRIMLELGPDDIHALWTYVTNAFPNDSRLKPLLLDAASPTMQQQFVSIADALEAKGLAKAVLSVIEARGLTLPEPLRQRIASCTDEAILHRWLRRACISTSTEDLLDDAPF